MAGGPSHLETFDYKPKLDELNGQPMPESFTKGQPIAQLQGQKLKVQGHLTKFQEFGTVMMRANPFMRPAIAAKRPEAEALVQSILTQAAMEVLR